MKFIALLAHAVKMQIQLNLKWTEKFKNLMLCKKMNFCLTFPKHSWNDFRGKYFKPINCVENFASKKIAKKLKNSETILDKIKPHKSKVD